MNVESLLRIIDSRWLNDESMVHKLKNLLISNSSWKCNEIIWSLLGLMKCLKRYSSVDSDSDENWSFRRNDGLVRIFWNRIFRLENDV